VKQRNEAGRTDPFEDFIGTVTHSPKSLMRGEVIGWASKGCRGSPAALRFAYLKPDVPNLVALQHGLVARPVASGVLRSISIFAPVLAAVDFIDKLVWRYLSPWVTYSALRYSQ
jgi:hypothetical protein